MDNFYKAVPIDTLNEIESKKSEINLEFGYDFEEIQVSSNEFDNLVQKPLNSVNKEYFSRKR